MARKPQVTRTIVTTKLNVLCLDTATCEPLNKEIILPHCKDDKKALKLAQETLTGTTIKAVEIVDKTDVETLYGMDETDFIKNATVLDPKTRKAIEE